MQGKQIKNALKNGDRVIGTHIISYANPQTMAWLTKVDLDFAFICTEHIPIDRTEVSAMCHTFSSHNISPMVRIAYPDEHLANMAIEGGAQGIVAPYVERVEQVERLVGSVRYRPIKGRFLDELLCGTRKPEPSLLQYMQSYNQDLYLIIGIESVAAIENLDPLLDISGVDGVFLGPHDITCSMQIPEEYEHPAFLDAVSHVVKACRSKAIGVGLHTDYANPSMSPLLDLGLNFILNHADVFKGLHALTGDIETLRARYGSLSKP